MEKNQLDHDASPTHFNLTPRGMMTPEGEQRVAKAMEAWQNTHSEVANRLTNFYEHYRAYFHGLCDPDEMDEIDALLKDRAEKQEEFLRAVAGVASR
jgi:hypothetical protein